MTPSRVRKLRSLWARRESTASFMVSANATQPPRRFAAFVTRGTAARAGLGRPAKLSIGATPKPVTTLQALRNKDNTRNFGLGKRIGGSRFAFPAGRVYSRESGKLSVSCGTSGGTPFSSIYGCFFMYLYGLAM